MNNNNNVILRLNGNSHAHHAVKHEEALTHEGRPYLATAAKFTVFTGEMGDSSKVGDIFCTAHKANALGTKILGPKNQSPQVDILTIYQALSANKTVRAGAEAFIRENELDIDVNDLLLVANEDDEGNYSFQFFYRTEDCQEFSRNITDCLLVDNELTDDNGALINESFSNDTNLQKLGISFNNLTQLAQVVLNITNEQYRACLGNHQHGHGTDGHGTTSTTSDNNVLGTLHLATLPASNNIPINNNIPADQKNFFKEFSQDTEEGSDDDHFVNNNNNNNNNSHKPRVSNFLRHGDINHGLDVVGDEEGYSTENDDDSLVNGNSKHSGAGADQSRNKRKHDKDAEKNARKQKNSGDELSDHNHHRSRRNGKNNIYNNNYSTSSDHLHNNHLGEISSDSDNENNNANKNLRKKKRVVTATHNTGTSTITSGSSRLKDSNKKDGVNHDDNSNHDKKKKDGLTLSPLLKGSEVFTNLDLLTNNNVIVATVTTPNTSTSTLGGGGLSGSKDPSTNDDKNNNNNSDDKKLNNSASASTSGSQTTDTNNTNNTNNISTTSIALVDINSLNLTKRPLAIDPVRLPPVVIPIQQPQIVYGQQTYYMQQPQQQQQAYPAPQGMSLFNWPTYNPPGANHQVWDHSSVQTGQPTSYRYVGQLSHSLRPGYDVNNQFVNGAHFYNQQQSHHQNLVNHNGVVQSGNVLYQQGGYIQQVQQGAFAPRRREMVINGRVVYVPY